jgi:hypothetical protein
MPLILYCRSNFSSKPSFSLLLMLLNYFQNGELCVLYMYYHMSEPIYICHIRGKVCMRV